MKFLYACIHIYGRRYVMLVGVYVYAFVCVCVWERERERVKE